MAYIAFVGGMRSGKTTAAKWLVENRDYHRYAFGDDVKAAAAGMLTALDAYIHDGDVTRVWTEAEINSFKARAGIRRLVQNAGDELGRGLLGHRDVWLDRLAKKLEYDPHPNIVVDDVRYANEYTYLASIGFRMIRIGRRVERERELEILAIYGDEGKLMLNHQSEQEHLTLACHESVYAEATTELIDQIRIKHDTFWS